MGCGASLPADQHVIIVGAGYAGVSLALELLKINANFTLINPGDSFHHNIAAVRAVCVSGWAAKSLIPLEKTFGAHFKQGTVVEIKPEVNKVLLESGEQLTYQTLVIATGPCTKWPFKIIPKSRDDTIQHYEELVEKVKKASRVVVIGGGPTGVETAAELGENYPDKQVTLINSTEALLTPKLSSKGQETVQNYLKNTFKVRLILGESVVNYDEIPEDGPCILRTDKGTEVEADIVFKATGLKVNTAAFNNGLANAMDEGGRLKVNLFLQVEGYDGIYAMGDSTNLPETKLAYYAWAHGKAVFKNICAASAGQRLSAYKPNGSPALSIISVGSKRGFAETPGGWSFPSFVVTKLKSKDLLFARYWKEMSQAVPN